jgi:prolyl oligopeptidase
MDLIAMPRDPYGRYALANEYADPDDPAEVVRLSRFSPYHLVDSAATYPSLFIEAGSTDPRCPPWHARKFAARVQATPTRATRPVLLRVRDKAGHGFATDKAIQRESYAGWLAFLMRELEMQPEQR